MSRKYRARMVYSINLNFKKLFFVFLIVLFITASSFVYKWVESALQPIVTTLALSEANSFATELVNEAVNEVAVKNADYSNLYTINKKENGEILSLVANPREINNLKTQITKRLIETVKPPTLYEIYIPIGNITKTYILSGRGPKIPIKLLLTGSPKIDFDNKFESAGINQTKHKVSVITYVEYDIILPYETVRTTMETETMLYETVIVGNIPNVYISR